MNSGKSLLNSFGTFGHDHVHTQTRWGAAAAIVASLPLFGAIFLVGYVRTLVPICNLINILCLVLLLVGNVKEQRLLYWPIILLLVSRR